ncbi:MAG TPA: DNA polymerase III subunit alpha [Candidatus Dormibacteraeota bacterium]|nr:DNA polymerase III subunit alpha [Candidatus Dormibacteraeota bacterium]
MGFAHLHLHTQYSLLDGANKIADLIPRVKSLGMPAVAMTDHGNMFGAVEFYKTAVAAGVQPIIGCEMYVAPGDRRDKQRVVKSGDEFETAGNFHLILLAMNEEGYRNLCRLVTLGYTEGFYYKPRIDKSLLRELNGGLIALSGCLASEVNQALMTGSIDRARGVLAEYREIFDGRYYVEIQDNHLAQQERANRELVALAGELSLPLVATNDCHYLQPGDHHAHDVLLCIQTGRTLNDEKRWRFGTDQLYVKGPEEMLAAFPQHDEAIRNTLDVVRRCDLEMQFGRYQFPVYQVPKGSTLEEQLERDARVGLEERLTGVRILGEWDAAREQIYQNRLASELDVIKRMGFAGYFLIVADFTNYAKRQGIPVGPGRGSAAGSLVAWALRITDLDPIPYNLLFERFLNPERKSMPDIDMDFCFERRDEVIRYVRERYGEDHVAQIITFGTLKGKAAIKDVGRVLEFTFGETDKIAKLYPAPKQGKDFSLTDALQMEPRLRELRDKGEREQQLFTHALKLEGLLRHASKHAAGIVIGSRPLVEDLPLFVDKEGSVMTQFSGPHVDEIGLIKFDFLGLKTLTLVHNVVRRIREGRDVAIDVATLPLDDKPTYRLIAKGDTVGVFQMESGGMRKLVTQLRPTTFEDIIAVLALFRPGPLDSGMVEQFIKRKHGKEEVKYPHPKLEPILEPTYGVIVYQEQVMQIAQVLAGYSLGDADNLRRAMGKKDAGKMKKERERFIAGAAAQKIAEMKAVEIFDQMETFAQYGFNKSHSAAYALVSFQTAYLKAHFREEFMAGLLTMEMGDTDKTFKNIAECREHGIRILPPDVNESRQDFTVRAQPDDNGLRPIRFGLCAVRGVGSKAVDAILAARDADGPFTSLANFCKRVLASRGGEANGEGGEVVSAPAAVNKKVIESLIKCGAFDSLAAARRQLLDGLDKALAWGASHAKEDTQQIGLFSSKGIAVEAPEPTLPPLTPWPDRERLKAEHEALGFYITAHPLDKYEADLKRFTTALCEQLPDKPDQSKVTVGGVIQRLQLKNSRKGDRYAAFILEDKTGTVEVICWPETYRKAEIDFTTDEPVCVTGTLEVGEERCQIIADEVTLLTHFRARTAQEVHLALVAERVTDDLFARLKATLSEHRGDCPCYLHLLLPNRTETVIALPRELRVAATEGMLEAVEQLCGRGVASLV